MKDTVSVLLISVLFLALSCSERNEFIDTTNIDSIAVSYVKLSFALSVYDKDFVDGYFGPEYIRTSALKDTLKIEKIFELSNVLLSNLDSQTGNAKRAAFLKHLIVSLRTRAEIFNGRKYSFDRESELIYNVRSPIYSPEFYRTALAQIDSLLPGRGSINERWNIFRKQFIIPDAKLDTVFKIAIGECRKRTISNISLPDSEKFNFEFIDSAPWGAYNWFKGNAVSLIQINKGLPVYIDRAIDYACHEGYPGHHVYHSLQESILYKKNKMIEHSLVPLFSPKAVLSEGLANYGINVAFSPEEKLNFEKNILCRLAGISSQNLDKYYKLLNLRKHLKYAGIETARRYLDGRMSKEMAVQWLMMYELRTQEEAENSIKFIEKYRSYIITYSVGYDLISEYFRKQNADTPEKKWKIYNELLSKPVLPDDLR